MPILLSAPALAADPGKNEIVAYARSIKPLRAVDVIDEIKKRQGKPVMLFVYASWCPYCREAMKSIDQLYAENAFANIDVLYFSVDNDFLKLSEYTLRGGYDKHATPFILKSTGTASTPDVFAQSWGSSFDGGIPYFAFFDAEGRLVDEAPGAIPKSELAQRLKKLTSD